MNDETPDGDIASNAGAQHRDDHDGIQVATEQAPGVTSDEPPDDRHPEPAHLGNVAANYPEQTQEIHQVASTVDDSSLAPGEPVFTEDVEALSRVSSGPAYSAFSPGTKRWIMVMVTISGVISPMTANIYFPALSSVAESLDVSTSLINLTLTTYMVMQGLSPTLFGDFGDTVGRRPAFTLAFTIYLFANIGLAVQRDYVALMILRCLQSFGSSGTLALGYAVVADISSSAERGRYMGIVGLGINFGPAVGPVLGGILSEYLDWPSIFWFCAIFVFIWLIPWVLTVPETCRAVVGNGSIPPPVWNQPLMYLLWPRCFGDREERPESAPKVKIKLPNPLRTLGVVFKKEEGLILFISAIMYLNFILVGATLGTLFEQIYEYNDLEAGLCYLPYGIGSCIAVFGQGYILDWNYRRIARKLGMPVSSKRLDDLSNFPIESARIQPTYPAVVAGAIALFGWGWSLDQETSVAVPLVLLFIIGMLVPTSFSVLNTLLVDLNADAPATAAAANNLVRCSCGAAATAVIDYMLEGMGRGWCFTFLALLILACLPGLRLLEKRGPRWRAEQALKRAAAPEAAGPHEK